MPDLDQLASRQIAHLHVGGAAINIEHLWQEGQVTCGGCGQAHDDPGLVGLTLIQDDSPEEGDGLPDDPEDTFELPPIIMAIMSPQQALLVANRIERAAYLALEGTEDPPDFAREARRMAGAIAEELPSS